MISDHAARGRPRPPGPLGTTRRGALLGGGGLAALALAGCINRESASLTPGADLAALRSFYVVRFGPDTRGINRIIADELARMGYAATTGEEAAEPADVDAVVTYTDRWMWDMTMYMLSLDIFVRNPRTGYPIATGNSYHSSLTRRSPEEMVREVLGNIFRSAPR